MPMKNKVEIYISTPNGQVSKDHNSDDWENRKKDWISFYRRNIHRFVQHYFKINLFPYQILWIYFMHLCDYFISIASRASAKSWLIAVYAMAVATLYPNSKIVLVSATQKMASIVMSKIEALRREYPNVDKEISALYNSSNNRVCTLYNTSEIMVVACRDSGRGNRANLTIGDEFRIMDKANYDAIVKPFAIARQAPYMILPEYANLPPEEPKEILISSAYHRNLWWFDESKRAIKSMLLGKSVGFIALDYLIAVHHRIKTVKSIEKEKATMDEITFQEEYCNIPWGENADAYFKLSMFEKARGLKKAFYPQRNDTYAKNKNPYDIKKVDGEVRVVSCDVASRANSANDNTILTCARLLPTANGYIREISYIESHFGANTILQAIRIKQLFYDFSADYFGN